MCAVAVSWFQVASKIPSVAAPVLEHVKGLLDSFDSILPCHSLVNHDDVVAIATADPSIIKPEIRLFCTAFPDLEKAERRINLARLNRIFPALLQVLRHLWEDPFQALDVFQNDYLSTDAISRDPHGAERD